MGRDLLEGLAGTVNTNRRELRIGSGSSYLHDSSAGHYAVDLQPGLWKTLHGSQNYRKIDDTIPRSLLPKERVGSPKPQQVRTGRAAKLLGAMCMMVGRRSQPLVNPVDMNTLHTTPWLAGGT